MPIKVEAPTDAPMTYAAVVGTPMPRISVVTISSAPAISVLPCETDVITLEIETISPVTVRQATNMLAPAQASATIVMLRPALARILNARRGPMRVSLRNHDTTNVATIDQKAEKCGEKFSISRTISKITGSNRCASAATTRQVGISDGSTPVSRSRLASKCTLIRIMKK